MKILAIGDPHGNLDDIRKIPLDADLILITGDLGKADLARKMFFENLRRKREGLPEKEYSANQEKMAFMQAYNSSMRLVRYLRRFAPVFSIFGNLESSNVETRRLSKKHGIELPFLSNSLNDLPDVRVINNRVANFQGVRIGCLEYFLDACWAKEFRPDDKSIADRAKRQSEKARIFLKNFGRTDILVCHQPPYGILDEVDAKFAPKEWQGKHAGSKLIRDYIEKYSPRYVFCGHIHEAEGMKKVGRTEVYNLGNCGYKSVELS